MWMIDEFVFVEEEANIPSRVSGRFPNGVSIEIPVCEYYLEK